MPILNHQDTKICYETFGDKENPCVILVAGITAQLISWQPAFIQQIVDAGFYVITFDHRDVGFSQYYDELPTPSLSEAIEKLQQGEMFEIPYQLADMAGDIVALMDGLGIAKTHLVGMSMGGQIAQLFSIAYPDRLLSLTLVATTSADADLPPPKPEILEFFFKPVSDPNNIDEAIARHLVQYQLYNHVDDYDEGSMGAILRNSYQRAFHPAGNHRQLLATMTATPRGEQLKSVTTPTLIIHGSVDPIYDVAHAEHLLECFPNSELKIIDKMGHGLPPRVASLAADAMVQHFKQSD